MGIFDELLPKSQSSIKTGGTSGSQQDPIPTQPVIISESESIVTSKDVFDTLPEITETETEVKTTPEEVAKIEENTSVLIEDESISPISISDELNTDKNIAFLNSEEKETTLSIPEESSVSPFFDIMGGSSPSEEIHFNNLDTPEVPASGTFQDTNEYIDHALVGVNSLMENLEKADVKKLAEEEEYKHQQEHFSELAIQAEAEHQKILTEKAHAEKVKSYLEQEKVTNDAHTDAPLTMNPLDSAEPQTVASTEELVTIATPEETEAIA